MCLHPWLRSILHQYYWFKLWVLGYHAWIDYCVRVVLSRLGLWLNSKGEIVPNDEGTYRYGSENEVTMWYTMNMKDYFGST